MPGPTQSFADRTQRVDGSNERVEGSTRWLLVSTRWIEGYSIPTAPEGVWKGPPNVETPRGASPRRGRTVPLATTRPRGVWKGRDDVAAPETPHGASLHWGACLQNRHFSDTL